MQGEIYQEKIKGCSDSRYLAFPLRPYLCYVPGDLQEELSYLKSEVFPHLDSLCQARGTCFQPVDLQRNKGDIDEETASGEHSSSGLMDHNVQTTHKPPDLFDQLLKISMDLIDRTSFFICLLGHRYGRCLSGENVSQSDRACSLVARNLHVAAKAGYPWVMEDEYRTCSLTELEITKATFIDNHRCCFFYFKDYTPQSIEDGNSDEMLTFLNMLSTQTLSEKLCMRDLKKRIIDRCLPVRFFRNLHELGEMMRKDWEGVIGQFYGNLEHPISGCQDSFDLQYHESHTRALCKWFVPSAQATGILNILNKFVNPIKCNVKSETHPRNSGAHFRCDHDNKESEKSILTVCGGRGCGKSTLAAWWLQAFCRQNPDIPVISHFCGTSTSSIDVRSMLRQCTAELQRVHYAGNFPDWDDRLEEAVNLVPLHQVVQAFNAAANLGPCILLLDGIDLLVETQGLSMQEVKELRWLPDTLPPSCKMIITTTFTDLTCKRFTDRADVQILSCPALSNSKVQCSILLKHLSLPCKEPPTNVLKRIASKKLCHLPAVLALLGTELRTCGTQREKEEEIELLKEYIEVDSVPELWVKVIYRWVKDYSRTVQTKAISPRKVTGAQPNTVFSVEDLSGWVWDTLCLIHVSRAGLTEAQLLALLDNLGYCGNLRIKVLEWARLHSVFWPWVQEKANGHLTIMHQSLSQAMNLLLFGMEGQVKSQNYFHQFLADFFQKSSVELCSWARKIEEVPWHLKQTGSYRELHNFLSKPATIEFLSSSMKQYPQQTTDVIQYWALLKEMGFDPANSFQNLIAQSCNRIEHRVEYNDAHPPDHSSACRVALFCSRALLCLGETLHAEKLLLHVDQIFQKHEELDSDSLRLLLKVQHMLAKLYVQMHLLKETETYCHKGLKTAQSLTAAHLDSTEVKLIVGQLLCRLCLILLEDGRLYKVPGLFKEISSARYTSVHPCAEGTDLLLKAIHKMSLNEPKAAERCLQSALASRRRWCGPDHALVAEVEEQLADLWASTQTDTVWAQRKIVELYRHVISTKETEARQLQLASLQHSLTVTLVKLGKVLLRSCSKADRREGLDLLQRATDLRVCFLGPEHPLTRDWKHVSYTDIARTGHSSGNMKHSLDRLCPFKESHRVLQQLTSKPCITRPFNRLPKSSSAQRASPENLSCGHDETLKRPWTAFQVSVFGSQSDIRTLLPTGMFDRRLSLPRSAGGSFPGRCTRKL
ncbi:tetratricopeptide repeat protein 41 [Myxocyprinus asiaticus]|uniref:tetratricopeptide repeat protein 41 n=1 Tax=Myxocyprinus asiaticus TaxID=70543 RepID=UPI002221B10F|nr:tetratricopeptide repeat protein 41 [Myxocyprinus asiaticus]